MNTDMQRRALAARDAHLALMELKQIVDDAAQATHAAELEAVHLAFLPQQGGDVRTALRSVVNRLRSSNFETTLSEAREKLENAAS